MDHGEASTRQPAMMLLTEPHAVGDAQVVVEHAQEGYFDMPAKGGRPDLPDDVVQAAVEHMLSITYPDWPVDTR